MQKEMAERVKSMLLQSSFYEQKCDQCVQDKCGSTVCDVCFYHYLLLLAALT